MFCFPSRRALPIVFALATALLVPPTYAAPTKQTDKTSSAVEAAKSMQQTADGALRAFLAAMIGPDPAILHQVTLPVSDADFKLLAGGTPASEKDRATGVVGIASMQFRVVQIGDVIKLPNGNSFRVTKSDIDDDHVLLQMPGGPIPVLVQRIGKLWYVNAASIIAARKTAAELRKTLPKRPAAAPSHH